MDTERSTVSLRSCEGDVLGSLGEIYSHARLTLVHQMLLSCRWKRNLYYIHCVLPRPRLEFRRRRFAEKLHRSSSHREPKTSSLTGDSTALYPQDVGLPPSLPNHHNGSQTSHLRQDVADPRPPPRCDRSPNMPLTTFAKGGGGGAKAARHHFSPASRDDDRRHLTRAIPHYTRTNPATARHPKFCRQPIPPLASHPVD